MSRHEDEDEDEDANENADKSTTAPAVPKESPEFAEFKSLYPARSGDQPWSRALKAINARLREGHQWSDFLEGATRYAAFCESVKRTGTEFVKQAATFCGPDKAFLEDWTPPASKSELRQDKNIDEANAWLNAANE